MHRRPSPRHRRCSDRQPSRWPNRRCRRPDHHRPPGLSNRRRPESHYRPTQTGHRHRPFHPDRHRTLRPVLHRQRLQIHPPQRLFQSRLHRHPFVQKHRRLRRRFHLRHQRPPRNRRRFPLRPSIRRQHRSHHRMHLTLHPWRRLRRPRLRPIHRRCRTHRRSHRTRRLSCHCCRPTHHRNCRYCRPRHRQQQCFVHRPNCCSNSGKYFRWPRRRPMRRRLPCRRWCRRSDHRIPKRHPNCRSADPCWVSECLRTARRRRLTANPSSVGCRPTHRHRCRRTGRRSVHPAHRPVRHCLVNRPMRRAIHRMRRPMNHRHPRCRPTDRTHRRRNPPSCHPTIHRRRRLAIPTNPRTARREDHPGIRKNRLANRPSNRNCRRTIRRLRASKASMPRRSIHRHHPTIRPTDRWNRRSCRRACSNCCRRSNRKSQRNPTNCRKNRTIHPRSWACSATKACWKKKRSRRSRPSGMRRRCRWQSPALQSRAGGRLQGFCSSHSPEGNQELSDAGAGLSPRPGLGCDRRAERALSISIAPVTVPPWSVSARHRDRRRHRPGTIGADRQGDRRPCSVPEK